MTENIEVFTQSSIRIRDGERTIYVDPFRIEGNPRDADYVLITHDHYDHFSPEDIEKVSGKDTLLVVPEKMKAKAKKETGKEALTASPGARLDAGGLSLETVPAYNLKKPFHPKGAGWVGYILQVGEKRVYVAGDTDATGEARAVRCDIALVPIGGTYTMDAKEAADLVNEIRPEVVIPTHYGSIVGSPEDAEVFAGFVKKPILVERKIPF